MRNRVALAALAAITATAGCKKATKADTEKQADPAAAKQPKKCQSDDDCPKGTLCESNACVPEEVADKVRQAAKPVATLARAPSAIPEGPIPAIPSDKSNPPKGNEWVDGKEVNTQESNSQPDRCSMRILREWLQVSCREDYSGYEKMESFGLKNRDYFEFVQPGRVVSFVVRLRKGKTQSVRICGEDQRATLFVNWPAQEDRPIHVALGRGPACEGNDDKKK
jgi:hypothetical protein